MQARVGYVYKTEFTYGCFNKMTVSPILKADATHNASVLYLCTSPEF